jgi:nickel/cobalt transporter (NicO) family protein
MPDLASLIQSGSTNLWLFVPTAILLGALHGLEPGHSKTMMAAFIIAIRGTILQAALLGLAATVSHTAVVWVIALAGLHFGASWASELSEPYLQLVSAVAIIGIAIWMLWRVRQTQLGDHHHHGDGPRKIDLDHGTTVALDIFEDGVPPRWRIEQISGQRLQPEELSVETVRDDGTRQTFRFAPSDGLLESLEEIPEPHAFNAILRVAHGDHSQTYPLDFREQSHDHQGRLNVDVAHDAGAHEREHAEDIRRRFASGHVTTGQIVLFGLTGGLIPCPASITILLLCLQLKQFTLGTTLVLCFSIGLALTMVAVGTAAAMSVHHVATRWLGFDVIAKRAPYLSGALIILIGLYTGYIGWTGLANLHF